MDIALDVEVYCSDGVAGRSTAVVMNPTTNQVTHVVVQGHGSLIGEFLVPLEVIERSTAHQLQLRWTLAELAAAERFDKALLLGDEDAGQIAAGAGLWPYAVADETNFSAGATAAFVQVEEVPYGELAVHRGAHVHASDGRVGQVDDFLVDRGTSRITHMILHKGHLWGKRQISVPFSAIDHVADDVVYLKLDKAAVEQLPEVPKDRRQDIDRA